MSANIIPFAPQRSSEDFEAQAAAGDLRSQGVLLARRLIAVNNALAGAMDTLEDAFEILCEIGAYHITAFR
jgi:hypothetical protein